MKKARSLCKGVLGFFIAAIFIAKAICTPEFWTRCKTFGGLSPTHEPWPQNNLLFAEQLALEIAKRFLLSVRHLPMIGGLFLEHLKNHSSIAISGILSRLVFRPQLKHEDSGSFQKSNAQISTPSSLPLRNLHTSEKIHSGACDQRGEELCPRKYHWRLGAAFEE
jgi:hypothetical protein